MFVAVRVILHIVTARQDKDPALHMDDVDIGSIKARQHRPGDDLLDRAQRRLAPPEVEHAIHGAEQRVQLVGAEQDR